METYYEGADLAMMLYPSIDKLLEVPSKYSLIILAVNDTRFASLQEPTTRQK